MRRLARVLATAAISYCLRRTLPLLVGLEEPPALVWPADAAVMLMLSLAPLSDWPLLVLTAYGCGVAARLGSAGRPLAFAAQELLAGLVCWVGGGLCLRWMFDFGNVQELVRSRHFLFRLLLGPCTLNVVVAGAVGAAVTAANVDGVHFLQEWVTWFVGGVSGTYCTLYSGSVLLAACQSLQSRPGALMFASVAGLCSSWKHARRGVLYLVCLGLAIAPYTTDGIPFVLAAPVMMASIPLLGLVATHFSQLSSALLDGMFNVAMVLGTLARNGPIAIMYEGENPLSVFVLMHVMVLLTTVTSAYVAIGRRQTQHHKEQQRRRIEEKVAFFSHASHEFRTPLSVILGFVEEVLLEDLQPEGIREDLELVRASALGLVGLVNDLLCVFRMEKKGVEIVAAPVDTRGFLAWIDSTANKLARVKGIRVTTTMDGVPDTLCFDNGRIYQVALNLVSNAIKYTPDGGAVAIRMRFRGGVASIAVEDTGAGISVGDQARLFERFFRCAGTNAEGAGLGLAICKSILDAAGGSLAVQSTLGEGSTFTMTWPCAPSESSLTEERHAGTNGPAATTGANGPSDRPSTKNRPATGKGASGAEEGGAAGRADDGMEEKEEKDGAGGEGGGEFKLGEGMAAAAAAAAAADNAEAAAGTEPRKMPPLHILVVENSTPNQMLMVRILSKRGHTTEVVANGLHVVPALEKGSFDLVMLDLGLPGRSGKEVLHDIRNSPATCPFRDIPVVVISGHVLNEHRSMCQCLGANAFACKPFRAEAIESTLAEVWEAREGTAFRRGSSDTGRSFHR